MPEPGLIERLPTELLPQLQAAAPSGETVHVQLPGQLQDASGSLICWLVVTERSLLLVAPAAATRYVPLTDITTVRLEALLGGGRIVVENRRTEPIVLYFPSSVARKFTEAAETVQRLSSGEPGTAPAPPREENKRRTLRRLLGYLRPHRRHAAVLAAVLAVASTAELLPPFLVQRIVDGAPSGQNGARARGVVWLALAFLGARVLIWLCEVCRTRLSVSLGARITAEMRSQLHRRLQYLPMTFFDAWPVGALMSRVINDVSRVEEFLANGVPLLFTNALMFTGIIAFLLYTNVLLTLCVLAPAPLIALGAFRMWSWLREAQEAQASCWSRLIARLHESLGAIRVVKAHAQERREVMRFERLNGELFRASVTAEWESFRFFNIIYFLMSLGVVLVWYAGGAQVLGGRLTIGALMAIIGYLWMLYWPLQWLGQVNSSISQALVGAERVFEFLDTAPETGRSPAGTSLGRIAGRVSFRNVTFSYQPGSPVLHDITLEVEPGEMIGIVGRSGSGKTTLMNLLCRFYDVEAGSIAVDGRDIREVPLEDLRGQLGLVLQDPFLFRGTIAENIGYGRPDCNFRDVMEAAKIANAHTFILSKPDGYETQVGERGSRLSGGERQRIAIARAILRDPRILILDEATSSVDSESERLVQQAIERVARNRTTFVIAHRLSTLRSAGRVLVLEDGRAAEVGTPGELMARGTRYCHLVRLQREMTGAA